MKNSKETINIEILWGLPGSGKTTYAKSKLTDVYGFNNEKIFHIEFDAFHKNNKIEAFKDLVMYAFDHSIYRSKYSKIIIDSLITTNDDIEKVISIIQNVKIKSKIKIDIKYNIVFWKENRELCLRNDKYRRKINSKITIKNLKLEEPNIDRLGLSKKDVTYMDIVSKPDYLIFFDKLCDSLNLDKNPYWENNYYRAKKKDLLEAKFYSESWSMGGTSGSCWDDTKHPVDGEPALASFEDFDKVIMDIYPDCSFLKYKKLYNASVLADTYDEGDYYGGNIKHGYFVCDVKKLYDMLLEMEIIKGPDF